MWGFIFYDNRKAQNNVLSEMLNFIFGISKL
ncbi:hypothetical protein BHO_0900038 (plasmid) [Borrelia hermsii YBT]|uniref:Uncharacterized protein n=1 Tax=Borrelia hermsii YBT TaxID=1313295 RepID=W5T735_BORHE|nr:hypothetical protein BHO_0900038 [Borrelia hermsii YBT]